MGSGRPPKPIVYRGTRFPSYSALAAHLGLRTSAVASAVARGRVDRLGEPVDRIALMNAARRQPVRAAGHLWASQTDCARALNTTPTYIYRLLSIGDLERFARKRLGVE